MSESTVQHNLPLTSGNEANPTNKVVDCCISGKKIARHSCIIPIRQYKPVYNWPSPNTSHFTQREL